MKTTWVFVGGLCVESSEQAAITEVEEVCAGPGERGWGDQRSPWRPIERLAGINPAGTR